MKAARVPLLCLGLLLAFALAMGIAPSDRKTWALESSLLAVAVVAAVVTYRWFRFSDRAYVQATILFALHVMGAHYTYSATPIGAFVSHALGAERNHYDRFVHFAFGALMLTANREALVGAALPRGASARVGPALVLSVGLVTAWGALYEILEWLTAIVVDPAAGTAFLGTQGDVWDAQKDMACVAVGGVVGALIDGLALRRRA